MNFASGCAPTGDRPSMKNVGGNAQPVLLGRLLEQIFIDHPVDCCLAGIVELELSSGVDLPLRNPVVPHLCHHHA
jgi:hypothetical protein